MGLKINFVIFFQPLQGFLGLKNAPLKAAVPKSHSSLSSVESKMVQVALGAGLEQSDQA